MKAFKQLALIGPTASGKSALAIALAHKYNANILSLDSLAIYKEIDIVSAKPTTDEREGIKHYGLDELLPSEHFSVYTFAKLYEKAAQESQKENKSLVIVGGTSFYLKMLLDGLSPHPNLTLKHQQQANDMLQDLPQAYAFLHNIDETYMSNIEKNDSYRIQKALEIYFATNLTPSAYFKKNPPQPFIIDTLPIYEIDVERTLLKDRIAKRTKQMLNAGLIDEISMLERKYSREPNCMKAIGIKETLGYLDGLYTKEELLEKIATNTARLAKRQNTFNNSQFTAYRVTKKPLENLEEILLG